MADQNVSKKDKVGGTKKYFKDTVAELKKVIWPNKQQVINNTLAVIVMVLLIGSIIWIFDWPLSFGFDKLMTGIR